MEKSNKKEKATPRTVKEVAAELEELSLIVENLSSFMDTQNRINVKVLGMLASQQVTIDALAKREASESAYPKEPSDESLDLLLENTRSLTPSSQASIRELLAQGKRDREARIRRREERLDLDFPELQGGYGIVGFQNENLGELMNNPSLTGMTNLPIRSLRPERKSRPKVERKPRTRKEEIVVPKSETTMSILKRLRQWYSTHPQSEPTKDRKYTIVKWFELMPMEPRFIDGEEITEKNSLYGILPLMGRNYAKKLIEENRKDIEKYFEKSK